MIAASYTFSFFPHSYRCRQELFNTHRWPANAPISDGSPVWNSSMPCFGAGTRPFSGYRYLGLQLYRVSVRYRVRPQCCELDRSRDQRSEINGSHQVLRCRKSWRVYASSILSYWSREWYYFHTSLVLPDGLKSRFLGQPFLHGKEIRACVDFLLTPLSGPVAEISNDQRGDYRVSRNTLATPPLLPGRCFPSNALMIIL